jgi:hypothetical protein
MKIIGTYQWYRGDHHQRPIDLDPACLRERLAAPVWCVSNLPACHFWADYKASNWRTLNAIHVSG